jgi:hypothetical protein
MSKKFDNADDEFQPILKQMFVSEILNKRLNVEPEKIVCLRSNEKSKSKIAYVKKIEGPYALLTDKKFFMIFVTSNFDEQDTEEQKYTILHEYCHCAKNDEDEYMTVDHNLKDFTFLLKDAEHNTDLVDKFRFKNKNNERAVGNIGVLE